MSPLRMIFVELALYNKWQNQTLYAICSGLSVATLDAEQSCLFFGSLRLALDHIAHVDAALVGFIHTGEPQEDFHPGQPQFADFRALAHRRPYLDGEILNLVSSNGEEWLTSPVEFHSERLGRRRSFSRAFLLSQMFNHQTHHRSQATAALHELGYDYGPRTCP
jgi:uncharacterized damage-inducible protein DinB